jgi:hypothetical protein
VEEDVEGFVEERPVVGDAGPGPRAGDEVEEVVDPHELDAAVRDRAEKGQGLAHLGQEKQLGRSEAGEAPEPRQVADGPVSMHRDMGRGWDGVGGG